MSGLEKSFEEFAKANQIQDLDQKKGARMIYTAAWYARGNVWAQTVGIIFLLAFLAYFATLVDGK